MIRTKPEDEALLAALLAATQPGAAVSYDLLMAAHDRLKELLKQKGDMFQQLIEQMDEIDVLKERLKKYNDDCIF
jgi:hypothetical protein